MQRILSVDYGTVRTGIALSDLTQTIASPFCIITERDENRLAEKIVVIINENNVSKIIVGDPVNMNGTRGEKSDICHHLADTLKKLTNLPVIMWDERLTTVAAHLIMNENNHRGKKRSKRIDAVAAALILEGYLGRNRTTIQADT